MFWIILFILVITVSGFLALRSMRNFTVVSTPVQTLPYGAFLIRNKRAFNLETMDKLHAFSKASRTTFALERLFKGTESAFVIFAPINIADIAPDLNLLQLENYIPQNTEAFVWQVAPKHNKKKLFVSEDFLKEINLSEDQQFFWQIVCVPLGEHGFSVTIRGMVVAKDQILRIELAKKIDRHILNSTGLLKQNRVESGINLYSLFAGRVHSQIGAFEFKLTSSEIMSLLG